LQGKIGYARGIKTVINKPQATEIYLSYQQFIFIRLSQNYKLLNIIIGKQRAGTFLGLSEIKQI
jgi:hypothetical protein